MQTRKTPNTDTFYAVMKSPIAVEFLKYVYFYKVNWLYNSRILNPLLLRSIVFYLVNMAIDRAWMGDYPGKLPEHSYVQTISVYILYKIYIITCGFYAMKIH